MKKTCTMILLISGILVAALALILILRTFAYRFGKIPEPVEQHSFSVSSENSLRRFAGGLSIPTVSTTNYEETQLEPFDLFKDYIRQEYPEIFRTMETYTVNDYVLVFKWKGHHQQLGPILFLSHYDVVPAEYDLNRPNGWEYPPFSGTVAGGKIFGRGALDMKGVLFALLEASEELIVSGFKPERDIWMAFGHDEEVGGLQGALKIVQDFDHKDLKFDAVYDEGGIITRKGYISKLNSDVALIGVAEKGHVTVKITVRGMGGHASMPPRHGALGHAAFIIQKLEKNQMKARLISPIRDLLVNTGAAMDFPLRLVLANQWLLSPFLIKYLSKSASTNSLIRTTTAITMAMGSNAANVLPASAQIVADFRLLPGDRVEDVISHVRECCQGFDVRIDNLGCHEASEISMTGTRGFEVMKSTINKIFPGTIVTPYLTVTGTDSRKFEKVSRNIYRFLPVMLTEEEQRTIHNQNENISIENYLRMIAYYKELMSTYDQSAR